ncbi:carbohydrate kinase, partial [Escherichia coli]|nr:carbohydrate kinase [Escherichia coli]
LKGCRFVFQNSVMYYCCLRR